MRRRWARHIAVCAVGLAVACGQPDEVGSETSSGADAVEVGGDDSPAPAGDAPVEARVETVPVGEAGELAVQVIDRRRLELLEIRAADGWTAEDVEEERDELELVLRHDDGRTVEVEVQLRGGELTVEHD